MALARLADTERLVDQLHRFHIPAELFTGPLSKCQNPAKFRWAPCDPMGPGEKYWSAEQIGIFFQLVRRNKAIIQLAPRGDEGVFLALWDPLKNVYLEFDLAQMT